MGGAPKGAPPIFAYGTCGAARVTDSRCTRCVRAVPRSAMGRRQTSEAPSASRSTIVVPGGFQGAWGEARLPSTRWGKGSGPLAAVSLMAALVVAAVTPRTLLEPSVPQAARGTCGDAWRGVFSASGCHGHQPVAGDGRRSGFRRHGHRIRLLPRAPLSSGTARAGTQATSRALSSRPPSRRRRAIAGTAYVTVPKPRREWGLSQTARVFTITNPLPEISTFEPERVWAGSDGFTMVVRGSGFTVKSVVQLAGIDQVTTFVSRDTLTAEVPAEALQLVQGLSVRVYTPAPGGGLSASALLWVFEDSVPPVTEAQGLTGLWHRSPVVFSGRARRGAGCREDLLAHRPNGTVPGRDRVSVPHRRPLQ